MLKIQRSKVMKMKEGLTVYQVAVALIFVYTRLVVIQCQNNETQTQNPVLKSTMTLAPVMPTFTLPSLQPVVNRVFPIDEVFNLTTVPFSTRNLYQCTLLYSVVGSCPQCTKTWKHCQCTEDCMKSRSCCIDVDWDQNSPISTEIYLQRLVDKAKRYKNLSCRKLINVNKQESQTYYMVTTCLQGSSINDKQKCNENSGVLYANMPVLGNDGYLYKNAHCATCNFVEKYEHVNITGRCVGTPVFPPRRDLTMEDFSRFPQCLFMISSTHNKKLPTCKPQTFCTTENRTLYELCHAYDAPLSIPKYKNYHCFLCDKQGNKSLNLPTLTSGLDNYLHDSSRLPNGEDSTQYSTSFIITLDSSKHVVISNLKQKFPIRQFLNIPLDYIFPKDNGLEQYLCNSFNNRDKCCQCHSDCMIERKCCIDVFWNETNPLTLDSYLQTFTKKYNQIKDYTCEPVYPHAETLGHTAEHRLMIKTCASFASLEDATSCNQNSNDSTVGKVIPVFGSDGNLYVNAFCARCNMVFDYIFANVTIDCKQVKIGNESLKQRGLPSDCHFRMKNNNLYRSKQCNGYEHVTNRECTNSNDDVNRDLCNSYYGMFGDYANYHCWKCNNRDFTNAHLSSLVKYCDDTCTCFPQGDPPHLSSHLFSHTISFSSGVSKLAGDIFQETCQKGEAFDLKEFKCVRVTCSPNYELINLICERIPADNSTIVKSASHKRCLVARNSTIYVILSDNYTNNRKFLNEFKKAFLVVNASFQLIYSNDNTSIYKADSKANIELIQYLELDLVNSPMLQNEIVNIAIATDIDSSFISSIYGWNPSRIYPHYRLCSNISKRLNVENAQFTNNTCDVTLHNKHYLNNATSLWISFFNGTVTENIAVCDQFHLSSSCARKVLTENTSIDPDNNILIHTHGNGVDTYQPDEYIPLADGFSVCVTGTHPYNTSSRRTSSKFENLYITAYYISMVAVCISCVCYIWIIGTYLLFSELRTIPGFNNIFMCLSLFISDSFYLVSLGANDHPKACRGIAIVRHWSSLCAFMWTVVIASDLVSRFGSFSVASHDRYIQRVVWRCLFAFLIPTVVVVAAVILDTASKVNIGYGSDGICWITSLDARIGFYIVPVACMSLFTFLALVYTLSHIYKDKKRVENVLQRSQNSRKSFVKIALKLVIILGVTEFIGFVQISGSVLSKEEEIVNVTFKFLYSILRSFRGIMLWFVYILGGHVMNKYRKRFKKSLKKNGARPPINSHTTSTSV